jgi:hypothetical protein
MIIIGNPTDNLVYSSTDRGVKGRLVYVAVVKQTARMSNVAIDFGRFKACRREEV